MKPFYSDRFSLILSSPFALILFDLPGLSDSFDFLSVSGRQFYASNASVLTLCVSAKTFYLPKKKQRAGGLIIKCLISEPNRSMAYSWYLASSDCLSAEQRLLNSNKPSLCNHTVLVEYKATFRCFFYFRRYPRIAECAQDSIVAEKPWSSLTHRDV